MIFLPQSWQFEVMVLSSATSLANITLSNHMFISLSTAVESKYVLPLPLTGTVGAPKKVSVPLLKECKTTQKGELNLPP